MKISKIIICFIVLIVFAIVFVLMKSEKIPTYILNAKDIVSFSEKASRGDKEASWSLYQHFDEVGDKEKSLYWLKHGSSLGDSRSQFQIYVLLKDSNNQNDKNEAILELEKAAQNGDSQSQLRLGEVYRKGDLVSRDIDKAKIWLDKAVMNSEIEAMLDLSELLLDTDKDVVKSYGLTLLAKNMVKENKGYDVRINQIQKNIIEYINVNHLNTDHLRWQADQYAIQLNGVISKKK